MAGSKLTRFSGWHHPGLHRLIILHRFTVLEGDSLQQQFDPICSAYFAPTLFRFFNQLVRQAKEGHAGRDTQLRVRVVLCRTVANVDSIGSVVSKCCQCSVGKS